MPEVKVMIIGAKGSIGRRYMYGLTGMGIPHRGWDIRDRGLLDCSGCTHALVATPTSTHHAVVHELLTHWHDVRNILVEKPLSDSVKSATSMVDNAQKFGVNLHCVCNWRFCRDVLLKPKSHKIVYRTLTLGSEELWMNACQIVHYAKKNKPNLNMGDLWVCSIDDSPVMYEDVQMSYRHMLHDWLTGAKHMMTGEEGIEMIEEAIKWEKSSELLS
jgi:hypothetical protein